MKINSVNLDLHAKQNNSFMPAPECPVNTVTPKALSEDAYIGLTKVDIKKIQSFLHKQIERIY